MLNAKDDDVPVMDDFNREKRLFTVDEVKEFASTSLTNYYAMRDNANDEFEDYVIKNNAKLFVINLINSN